MIQLFICYTNDGKCAKICEFAFENHYHFFENFYENDTLNRTKPAIELLASLDENSNASKPSQNTMRW